MRYPKALLPFGKELFLTHILTTLDEAGLKDAIVVLGRHAGSIRPHIADREVRILINTNPERGQISSIQLAVENLLPECGGIIIWPVDQPAVSAGLVRRLVTSFQSSNSLLVFPSCEGRKGHPVIFHHSLFRELLDAAPETGAKSVVARHSGETLLLPTAETSTIMDVDTPEDYFNLTGAMIDGGRKGFGA